MIHNNIVLVELLQQSTLITLIKWNFTVIVKLLV